MSFDELDLGEQAAGKPVTEFTPKELFEYVYFMFEERFGYKLPVDFIKNMAVIKWYLKTYRVDGRRLVKWLFYKHDGSYRGEVFEIGWFQSGHKWWIDKRLHEMKVDLDEVKVVKRASRYGFMGIEEVRKYAKRTVEQEVPE